MGTLELLLLAVGLSMDAFAAAVSKGMAMERVTWGEAGAVGLYFGVFQAGMPLLGYIAGLRFQMAITAVDHWVAFVLLTALGGRMIAGALRTQDGPAAAAETALAARQMLPLALATSVDALAVGVSLAFLQVKIGPAAALIGAVTLLLSMLGTALGHAFGDRLSGRASLVGGGLLIVMGVRLLLTHLGGA